MEVGVRRGASVPTTAFVTVSITEMLADALLVTWTRLSLYLRTCTRDPIDRMENTFSASNGLRLILPISPPVASEGRP